MTEKCTGLVIFSWKLNTIWHTAKPRGDELLVLPRDDSQVTLTSRMMMQEPSSAQRKAFAA